MSARLPLSARMDWALLLAICVAGVALRLWGLNATPPGLYQDEAYYGIDAVNTARGDWQLYYPANNGREPLYIYLTAISVSLLGRTPLAERLPSALIGIALIPATYALGRALFNRRLALLAAAFVAFTFWPLALSRVGFRVGTLPLVAALSVACAAHGWRARRLGPMALGGALFGLLAYTYLSARFAPLALIAFGIFWYSARRPTIFPLREGAAFFVPAVIVAAPLAMVFISQPTLLMGRAEQVSIFSPAVNHGNMWGALFHNLWVSAGQFLGQGDFNARHNLPGRPVFDALSGAAFLMGMGVAGWRALRRREAASALTLIWVGVMLLPALLADSAPHFLRAAGVWPWLVFFPALGWDAVIAWLGARGRAKAGAALVGVAVCVSLGFTARDYFGPYARSTETAYYFQSAATTLAEQINATLRAGQPVHLDKRLWDSFASVRYLADESPDLNIWEAGAPLPAEGDLFVWPHADTRSALSGWPSAVSVMAEAGPLSRGDKEAAPYSLFTHYRWRAPSTASAAPLAEFEHGVQLLSASLTPTAAGLRVNLVWATRAEEWTENAPDYHVFVQLWDGDVSLVQDDGQPARGLYPTPWWRSGDVIADPHELQVAPLPSAAVVRVGLYNFATQERLRLLNGPNDFVELPWP